MAKPKSKRETQSRRQPQPEPQPAALARTRSEPSRFWFRLVCMALPVVAFSIYAQTAAYDFINYDDPNYVVRNEHVNRGLTWKGVQWAFRTFDFYYWQPLTWISHMLDCQLFGLDPGKHHLVNALLHAANALLALFAFFRLTSAFWPSAFLAGLFAFHPLRVESVAWIAERKDTLSGLFCFLTLLAYARYVRSPGAGRAVLVTAAFACGLMSKPSLVTLPFLLLLLDWWPLGRLHASPSIIWPLVREKWLLFVLAAAAGVLTFLGQHRMGATVPLAALPVWFRFWNATVSYAKYIGKFLWPTDLGIVYPYGRIAGAEVAAAAALLLAISILALRQARRRGYMLTGWFWFVIAMVPMIGLAQTGVQAYADRFTYLPGIGLAMMLSWGAADWMSRVRAPRAAVAAGACLLLGALSLQSWRQAGYWRDSITLFTHTIAVTKDNDLMHLNLATIYEERGDIDRALVHFLEAARIEPKNVQTHHVIGTLYSRKREYEKAIPHFQAALKFHPAHLGARKELAEAFIRLGRIEEARQQLQRVLEYAPDDFEAKAKMMLIDPQLRP